MALTEELANLHEYTRFLESVANSYYDRDLPKRGLEAENLALDIRTRLTVIELKIARGDELLDEAIIDNGDGHVLTHLRFE